MKKRAISFIILSMLFACVFGMAACGEDPVDTPPEAVYYTITFVTNGGNTIEPMQAQEAQQSPALPTPQKEGFVFDGWFENEDLSGTKLGNRIQNVQKDYTLYAQWLRSYNVSGFENGVGYTMAGNAENASEGKEYSFVVSVNTAYFAVAGELSTTYTVGEGTPVTITGTAGTAASGVTPYTFKIPASAVTADIVIGAVTGLSKIPGSGLTATGIVNGEGFTMQGLGGNPALDQAFKFIVTVQAGYEVVETTLTLDYSMGASSGTLTGVKGANPVDADDPIVYTFTIDKVTDDLVIVSEALSSKIAKKTGYANLVTGINHSDTYRIIAAGAVKANEDYKFKVVPRFGFDTTNAKAFYYLGEAVYEEVVVEPEQTGEEEEPGEPETVEVLKTTEATGTKAADGSWTFTIPWAVIDDAGDAVVTIASVTGVSDSVIQKNEDAAFMSDFFDPTKWVASTHASAGEPVAPTAADGVISFSGSNHGFYIGKENEEIHLSFDWFMSKADNAAEMFFFVDPDQTTEHVAAETATAKLALSTRNGETSSWKGGGFLFNRSDNRDWITMPIGSGKKGDSGGTNDDAVKNLTLAGQWVRMDIVIVQVGRSKIYKVYRDGQKLHMNIDGGNPTTRAPVNFTLNENGDMVEYLDAVDFLVTGPSGGNPGAGGEAADATRSPALFTTGNYFFVKTAASSDPENPTARFRYPVDTAE